MQSNMNRRVMMAGAAAVPVAALPALPTLAGEPDPVFAAIAKHREAYRLWVEALDVSGELPQNENPAAHELTEERCHAESDAAYDLAVVAPSTLAGVMALLAHVDDCNSGRVTAGKDSSRYSHDLWPDDVLENDERTPVPFAFWIMRNVQTALRNLTGGAA